MKTDERVVRLRSALRWIEQAAIHCDEPASVVYYANLANTLLRDVLVSEADEQGAAGVDGLHESGPLLLCKSCGHLLFDGREDLGLDVLGDGPHGPPVGLK